MSDNGIASAEDFKKAAEQMNPPERVVLPKSRLAVLLRRPTTFAVWMLDQKLAELQESGAKGPESESGKYGEWRGVIRRAVEEAFVQPKLSLTPGLREIHPSWLPEEDQLFVLRWVRGLIAPDGTDLVEEFFRTRGRPAESGASGERTGHTAVEDPGVVGALRDAS